MYDSYERGFDAGYRAAKFHIFTFGLVRLYRRIKNWHYLRYYRPPTKKEGKPSDLTLATRELFLRIREGNNARYRHN